MKKILFTLLFISSFVQAQYSIKGIMTPALKTDWVILYKVEGAKQNFVKNTDIKVDTVLVYGKKRSIGNFEFKLPANAEPGTYRVSYKVEGDGFLDFIFNKENISFSFNPDYPEQSVIFSESEENILYSKYLSEIQATQKHLDSLQVSTFKNAEIDLNKPYKAGLKEIKAIKTKYIKATNNKYVQPFITAASRVNPSELQKTPALYSKFRSSTFFSNLDFSNKTLLNSPFLVDRIADYVFYINYSKDKKTQQKLYKTSIDTALSKINTYSFKKDVIEFLTTQFEYYKNLEAIDYLLAKYNALPNDLKNKTFISEKRALFAAEVGRIAPDFSWKEGKKTLRLSTLKDAKTHILVFWSTTCSHCLKEIPELHKFTSNSKEDVKVIAFSLENDKFGWESYKPNLYGWHNVLGLNKWKNKTAKTYNIHQTPSYFILDANKKIIAKPEGLKDLKLFFNKK
jgi:thiol-disulfide isomerase/thioredoxin